jgi:hypothetical protein
MNMQNNGCACLCLSNLSGYLNSFMNTKRTSYLIYMTLYSILFYKVSPSSVGEPLASKKFLMGHNHDAFKKNKKEFIKYVHYIGLHVRLRYTHVCLKFAQCGIHMTTSGESLKVCDTVLKIE